MRLALKIIGLAVGILVIVAAALVISTFFGRTAIIDGFELNGVHVVKDGIVSLCIFPVGGGSVALIDAGNDSAGASILAELSRRNLGPDAVKAILLTHGHPDHIASIHLFSKAQVMALETEVPLVEGLTSGRGPVQRIMPAKPTGIKVTRALADGEEFQVGDVSVQVFGVPGHTAGSAAYLVNSVLILGDSADARPDGSLKPAPWLFSDDTAQDTASLVRLAHRLAPQGAVVKGIVFAHSGALAQGLAPLAAFANNN